MNIFVQINGETIELDIDGNIDIDDFIENLTDKVTIKRNHITRLFKGKTELTKDNLNELLENDMTILCSTCNWRELKNNYDNLIYEILSSFYFEFIEYEKKYPLVPLECYEESVREKKNIIIKNIILNSNITDYEKYNEEKNTLLMLEAEHSYENTDIIKTLINASSNVNAQNKHGKLL